MGRGSWCMMCICQTNTSKSRTRTPLSSVSALPGGLIYPTYHVWLHQEAHAHNHASLFEWLPTASVPQEEEKWRCWRQQPSPESHSRWLRLAPGWSLSSDSRQ